MADADHRVLLRTLVSLPRETEWVEFKHNNADHHQIGELISGLANAAALHSQDRAFLVWGVKDKTNEIVGTTFRPRQKKIGNEELENWLATLLDPRTHFWIREFVDDGKYCVIFEIEPATHQPIAFKGKRWIRIGSYNKPLQDHPDKERILWSKCFSRVTFELSAAKEDVTTDEALVLVRFGDYFDLTKQPIPPAKDAIADALCADRILVRSAADRVSISNLGALLFARDLRDFDGFQSKILRVIFYRGENRTAPASETKVPTGYASGFEGVVKFIENSLPPSEEISEALRTEVPVYPVVAIRELVANALIHQDLNTSGAGPLVEVFTDRIEITNPGTPLIEVQRFLDLPARSRNERLASLMHRAGICEERGTGIDKTLFAAEVHQLPPPDFRLVGNSVRAVLFAPRGFTEMTRAERIRACYQHAGLRVVSGQEMTNESLRRRFQIPESNYSTVSRVISDTIRAGLVKRSDPSSKSRRYAKYVPFWA